MCHGEKTDTKMGRGGDQCPHHRDGSHRWTYLPLQDAPNFSQAQLMCACRTVCILDFKGAATVAALSLHCSTEHYDRGLRRITTPRLWRFCEIYRNDILSVKIYYPEPATQA